MANIVYLIRSVVKTVITAFYKINYLLFIVLFNLINQINVAQDLEWFKQISNIEDDIDINEVVTDPFGDVYIGGSFDDQAPSVQVSFLGTTQTTTHEQMGFLAKVSSSGALQWMTKFGSTQSTTGYSPLAMVEKNGFLYVVGSFEYSAAPGLDFDPGVGTNNLQSIGNVDFFISKYNATTGAMIWAYKGSGSNGSDLATGIVIDNSENIYVTGFVNNGATPADFNIKVPTGISTQIGIASKLHIFLAKYDKDCNFLWRTNVANSSSNTTDAIAIDLANNYVYIAGNIAQSGGSNPVFTGNTLTCSSTSNECYIAKYNFSGACQWVNNTGRIIGAPVLSNVIRSIDVDGTGNIYVSGTFGSPTDFDPSTTTSSMTPVGSFDGFVAKYTPTGNLSWKYGIGSSSFSESINSIDVTSVGNIFIGGSLYGTADANPEGTGGSKMVGGASPVRSIFFGQYDANFKYKWAYALSATTSTNNANEANSVVIDKNNALAPVFVFGYMHHTTTENFNPSGAGVFGPSLVPQTSTGTSGGTNGFLAKYSTTSILLPIELVSFNALCNYNTTYVTWETASENHNNFFTIERSYNGIDFEPLTNISSKGNSSFKKHYEYDYTEVTDRQIYYRLKQTDFDGNFKYSLVISNYCNKNTTGIKLYPNPTSNTSMLYFPDELKTYQITIINILGELILSEIIDIDEINMNYKINADNFSNGLYLINVSDNYNTSTFKLLKTN